MGPLVMSLDVNARLLVLPGRITTKQTKEELSVLQTSRKDHPSHHVPFGGRERGDKVFIMDSLLDRLYIDNDLGWLA